MSRPDETPEAVGEEGAVEPKAPAPPRRYRRIAIGLGGALLLVVVAVASAPFWTPLLPWAGAPASTGAVPASGNRPVAPGQPETAPRVERSPPQSRQETDPQKIQEAAQPRDQQQQAAAGTALQHLDRRVGALEAKPIAAAGDIADIRQLLTRLASSVADLDTRVGALEARPAAPPSDTDDIRQQLARLASSVADLDARVAAIGKAAPAPAGDAPAGDAPAGDAPAGVDNTDVALVLVLLQIRGALEAGRPFAPEYEALAMLARSRPEIAAAAAPLAEPAKTGVAGRAVLARRLRELAGAIVAAEVPANNPADANGATAPDWVHQALVRLRGLVTVRRIDGAAPRQPDGGPQTAVNAAELALAGGDLAGALSALETLPGPSTDAAGPWLRMARERLSVEEALDRIAALLAARLGTAANGSPTARPDAPAAAPSAVPGSPR
jgi:hypothetical protein